MTNRAAPIPPGKPAFLSRWYAKPLLVVLTVVLLTLAFAPWKQFYLAWVGLVPWFYLIRESKNQWRAFLWSWLAGTLFFVANMWWLAYVTVPGMLALLVYLGLYWGIAALVLRGLGWIQRDVPSPAPVKETVAVLLGVAIAWSALEWIRGNLFTGLPWLYLGHTQSPLLIMCQIADVAGVYGIGFWVAALNFAVYLILIRHRARWTTAIFVAALLILILGYGLFRDLQTPRKLTAGPRVLVIQPNSPQDNGGNKGASESQTVDFHIETTTAAVRSQGQIDLACWSETTMPQINEEAIRVLAAYTVKTESGNHNRGSMLQETVSRIQSLCQRSHVNVITGGLYFANAIEQDGSVTFTDRRNTAYLFRTDGRMDLEHYDKSHLVPFGEFIPFKNSFWLGWLHDFFLRFSPYDYDYTLTAGSEDSPTVFRLNIQGVPGARIITPICFEDIDSGLCAKLFRSADGKRADLIINLTNDGWFRANENAQHFQAALFRSIENRVAMARTVNTGMSGFIDSYGRVTDTIPVRTEGVAVQKMMLDSRYTLYTRVGDLFAWVCTLITALLVLPALVKRFSRRKCPAQ